MINEKQYDLIVLGSGLSGLIAAAWMARRGRRVLVVDEGTAPGGASLRIGRDAFSYVRGPALFLGFEQDGLYDRLFIELGLSLSVLKQNKDLFQKSNPPFQVVLPGHRINFYSDPEELSDELVREFPDHTDGIRSFLNEAERWGKILLPPYLRIRRPGAKGLRQRVVNLQDHFKWRASLRALQGEPAESLLKRFSLDEELCRGLGLILSLFSDTPIDHATGLDLMLLMGLLRRDVASIQGGVPRLSEILVKAVLEYQGSVISSSRLEELIVKKKRLVAIRTKDEEIEVRGDCILNLPHRRLPTVASHAQTFMSFYFGIHSNILPSPMKEHILLAGDFSSPLLDKDFLFLSISGKNDDRAAPQGHRALQAIVRLEKPGEPTRSELDELSEAITRRLTDLIPFSSHSLVAVGHDLWSHDIDPAPLSAATPLVDRLRNRGHDGTAYYTLPVKNLFVLPDDGDRPAAHLWQARSAFELSEYLLEKG